jgi:hypothetical protein
MQDQKSGADAACEAPEPTHPAAAQEQLDDGFLAQMLHHPQELRARDPTNDPGKAGVRSLPRAVPHVVALDRTPRLQPWPRRRP